MKKLYKIFGLYNKYIQNYFGLIAAFKSTSAPTTTPSPTAILAPIAPIFTSTSQGITMRMTIVIGLKVCKL